MTKTQTQLNIIRINLHNDVRRRQENLTKSQAAGASEDTLTGIQQKIDILEKWRTLANLMLDHVEQHPKSWDTVRIAAQTLASDLHQHNPAGAPAARRIFDHPNSKNETNFTTA